MGRTMVASLFAIPPPSVEYLFSISFAPSFSAKLLFLLFSGCFNPPLSRSLAFSYFLSLLYQNLYFAFAFLLLYRK
ncbi:hypothetical protein BKA57DRAFT_474331 [Linnemannia elongata]|nr:hypothetical protein BKA57DRAFT_474331 [Linnemannia elongata]